MTAEKPFSPLMTDLYELTMAYAYWKSGKASDQAVYTLSFRTIPFGGGYAIACGLEPVVEFLKAFRFEKDDLAYLATLAADGVPLFESDFIDYLGSLELTVDVDAVPEGTVVFPNEPLVRVRGPIIQGQLLETALLTLVNFHTLIATKAARVCEAARGEPVLEFGLRRAQGVDGGLSASRAAFLGGCAATSNVLAGKRFGIPVRGTHAHSWVMSFEAEQDAFDTYARAMPHNCVLLVDTYDTLQGVRHAIETGKMLRRAGHDLQGIRLDSGDLAWLSTEARKALDEAGFDKTAIVASNDLDEHLIQSLKDQGAAIGIWGVGTRLVTGHHDGAMNGTYKLTALRRPEQPWQRVIKLSNQIAKISTPGILDTRRFVHGGEFIGDCIFDAELGIGADPVIIDPKDFTRRKRFEEGTAHQDLLVPVLREGRIVHRTVDLETLRARARAQVSCLHPSIRRFENPHEYPVGLEAELYRLKTDLILRARGIEQQ